MRKLLIQAALRLALIVVGIAGIILTCFSSSFMGNRVTFMFFTVQSNITIIAITMVFLVDTIIQIAGKKSFINDVLLKIKYVFVVAITITCLVFFFMLAPTVGLDYLLSFNNFSLHAIVPILAIVDFFLYDKDIKLTLPSSLLGTAMPFYYLIFFLVGIPLNFRYLNNSVAPYFFLDYQTLTWFKFTSNGPGVFYYIIFMLIGISGLCLIYYFLVKLRKGKSKDK